MIRNYPAEGRPRPVASGTIAMMLTLDRPPTRLAPPPSRGKPLAVAAAIELVLAAGVFFVYRAGRLVTSDSTTVATHNADRLIGWERSIGVFSEQSVQRWALDIPGVMEFLNRYYVFVHFPVSTAFLVWVFARRREHYALIRNWFAGVTLLGLIIHVLFPLAPPRMTHGFVDTLRVIGPNIYPEDTSGSVANQFAAMPSLHFGWALMVAVGMALLTQRHRLVWMLHPAVTLLAIVATGNHYWTDAAVAGVLAAAVGWVVLRLPSAVGSTRQTVDGLAELAHRVGDDVGNRSHGVDTSGDLAGERDRGLHVAAEVQRHGVGELAHHVEVGITEFARACRAQRPQRGGVAVVEHDRVGFGGCHDRLLPVLVDG
jgi:hypothetical protein